MELLTAVGYNSSHIANESLITSVLSSIAVFIPIYPFASLTNDWDIAVDNNSSYPSTTNEP